MPLDIVSTTEQKVSIYANPTTATGKPSAIEGQAVVTILTGGATAAQATQAEIDAETAAGRLGLSGYVISEDTAGVSTWKIDGDADLGAGVTTISDGGTYTYNSPQAANLGITGGTPIAK